MEIESSLSSWLALGSTSMLNFVFPASSKSVKFSSWNPFKVMAVDALDHPGPSQIDDCNSNHNRHCNHNGNFNRNINCNRDRDGTCNLTRNRNCNCHRDRNCNHNRN